jgi:substrate import-associated zinc metallohydrolase lipoprotein
MKNIKNITFIACLLLLLASCKKEEDLNVQQPVGLGGEPSTNTAIDKWILDSLTTPYNISALYKWNPFNQTIYKTLTPADESRVIPLFSALKQVWINPYNQETGSELFMKKYSPKQLVLIGSVSYDVYTVTLGQAEGGNNIVFFDVNQNYDKNPLTSIRRVIHTAHHEFAHILHQNIMYTPDFVGIPTKLGITGAGYTPTWFNISNATALSLGYATNYSMSGPDDDFVEQIATMLTEGKTRWEEIKNSTNALAKQALQQKENIIVAYYLQAWKIDFYSLQAKVQAALLSLYPAPTVLNTYGFGKQYTRASVDPANQTLLPQPAAFMTIFNSAKTAMAGTNRVLDSFALIQNSATTAQLRIYAKNSAGANFQANYNYTVTKDASDVFTYTYVSSDANGTAIAALVKPLVDYISNNKFTVTWHTDPTVSIYPRVKFTPQAIPGTYFLARLLL